MRVNTAPNESREATGSLIGTKVVLHSTLIDSSGASFGSAASPLVVSQNPAVLASQGKAYVMASGPLALTGAGSLRITFSNPAGSGVTAVVSSLVTFNSTSLGATASFFQSPTAGLPATAAAPFMNAYLGGPAPKCVLKADTSLTTPLSGGTSLISIIVPPGVRDYNDGTFYVPAGVTIGFNLAFAGSATSELVVYYAEV